jgi:hypothetical protein
MQLIEEQAVKETPSIKMNFYISVANKIRIKSA